LYRLLRQAALLNAVLNTQDRRTLLNRVFSEWDATEHPWISVDERTRPDAKQNDCRVRS
jgi:hypothetical protein